MTTLQVNKDIFESLGIIAEDENLMKRAAKYLKKLATSKRIESSDKSMDVDTTFPNYITPELQAKIDKAHEDMRKGNVITCNSSEELDRFLDAL